MRYLVGVGNYLRGDDGVGVWVVSHVVDHGLEQGFVALDLGTRSLDLVHYFTPECDRMVIVDCAFMGLAAGESRLFEAAAVTSVKPAGSVSTHEGDILKVVELARTLGMPVPHLRVLGIEPGSCDEGMSLSAALAAKLPSYAEDAIRHLTQDA